MMIYKKVERGVELKIDEFSLRKTFECGQCFRWCEVSENVFKGVAKGKFLTLLNEGDKIIFKDVSIPEFENIWIDYFDLTTDYIDIKNQLLKIHPVLSEAVKFSSGIRILRQDRWEALCSFIISQNNNIPRIMNIISELCKSFGERISENSFSFPSARKISKLDENNLSVLRAGFRTKYILDAARKIAEGKIDLKSISSMTLHDARKTLMKICGVGPKVAECTLLYGFHRLDAFPIDVWMKRAMKTLLNGIDPCELGKYAGVAQQYIFYYSRMNKEFFCH